MKSSRLSFKKLAVFSSVILVGLTALVGARANSVSRYTATHAENQNLAAEAESAESILTDRELIFLLEYSEAEAEVDFEAEASTDTKTPTKKPRRKRALPEENFRYTAAGGFDSLNPFCERFINPTGKYGIYGKIVADYLHTKFQKNQTTTMFADDLIGMEHSPGVCPRWRELGPEDKIRFWVWTFAAISSVESTCGALNHARGIPVYSRDGHKFVRFKKAVGLLQMEGDLADRRPRGYASCNVSSAEIVKPYSNLRCGMDIMEGFLAGNAKRDPWPIYQAQASRTSYWQHLRIKNGGTIGRLMRSFEPCFIPPKKEVPAPEFPGPVTPPAPTSPWYVRPYSP